MGQLSLWGGETGADLHTTIERNGYALIEHGIPNEVINDFVEAYATFTDNFPDPKPATMNAMIQKITDLDSLAFHRDTQTEWHKYRTNTPHLAKPNGYTNRSYQATVLRQFDRRVYNKKTGKLEYLVEDPKEFFHYKPNMLQAVEKRHELYNWGPIPPEVKKLLFRAHAVHYLAKMAMAKFYAKLEDTHHNLGQYITPQDLDISPIRLLFYHKNQGDKLAAGHYDRGFGTLQIAESHMGLRFRNPQTNEMEFINRESCYGVAFPSLKWRQANPDSSLRPLWHDVINYNVPYEDRILTGRNVARWSIIFFTNSQKLAQHTDKNVTHNEAVIPTDNTKLVGEQIA